MVSKLYLNSAVMMLLSIPAVAQTVPQNYYPVIQQPYAQPNLQPVIHGYQAGYPIGPYGGGSYVYVPPALNNPQMMPGGVDGSAANAANAANPNIVSDPQSTGSIGAHPMNSDFTRYSPQHQDGSVRPDLVRKAARAAGIREGYALELKAINEHLTNSGLSARYDQKFNFSALMIDGAILPPVISEVSNIMENPNAQTLRLTLGSFRIVRPARLVAQAPTWRDYLIDNNIAVSEGASLQPDNDTEKKLYADAFQDGILTGRNEARELFKENLNRLIRDYDGHVLYHELAQKGAISLPSVSRQSSARTRVSENGRALTVGRSEIKLIVSPKFRVSKQRAAN